MIKKISHIVLALMVMFCAIMPSYAGIKDEAQKFVRKYELLLNQHDIKALEKVYHKNYVSNDELDKELTLKLLNESWQEFPDLSYKVDVLKITKRSNKLVDIETEDSSEGMTSKISAITGDRGLLTSEANRIIQLEKFGEKWLITSDNTLSEIAYIKYGRAKGIESSITAPVLIRSNSDYTASVYTNVPDGTFAIASITREPIVYPTVSSKEVFRHVPKESGLVERIIRANSTNNNEIAVASVAYSELEKTQKSYSSIKLTGVALLMQRVNVVPKSLFKHQDEKELSNNEE